MARHKSRPVQVRPDPAREFAGSPPSGANVTSEPSPEPPSTFIESEVDEPIRLVEISSSRIQPISSLSQSNQSDSKTRRLMESPLTTCPHCEIQFVDMGVADIRDHVQSCITHEDDGDSASSGLSPPPLDEPPPVDDGEFMPPPYVSTGITLYPERRGDALANDENLPQIRLGKITDAEAFGLESPEDLSHSQLFNRVENAQQALVAYQDEWMELERFVKGHEAQGIGIGKEREKEKEVNEPDKGRVINPRVPKPSMIGVGYQDQLEAYAYGFEHNPHPSLLGKQNAIKQRYSDEMDGRKLRMRTKSQKAAEAGMSTSSESEDIGQNGRPKRAVRNREGSVDSAAALRNTNASSRYNSEAPRSRQLKTAGTFPSGKRIGRPPKQRILAIQQDEGAAAKFENNGLNFPGLTRRRSKLFEQYPSDNEDSQGDTRETTELWYEDGAQHAFGTGPGNSSSNATRQSTGTSDSQQSDDSDAFTLSRNRPRNNTSDFEDGRPAKLRGRRNAQADQPLNVDAFDGQLSQSSRARVPAKSGNRSQGAQKGWIKRKNNLLNQTKDAEDQVNTDGDVDSDASDDESVYPRSRAANINKKPAPQIDGEMGELEKLNPPQKLSRAELSSKNQKAAWAKDDGTRRAKSSETMKRRWAIAKATGNTAGLVGKSKSGGARVEKGSQKPPILEGSKKVKREIGQTAASRNMINRWKKKKAADMLGIKAPHIGRHKREKSDYSMTPEASSNTDMAGGNNSQKRKRVDDESEASGYEQVDSRYSESVSLPNPSPSIAFDRFQVEPTLAALEAIGRAPFEHPMTMELGELNGRRQKLVIDEDGKVRSVSEAVSSPTRSRGGRRKKAETFSDYYPEIERNAGEEDEALISETPQSAKTRTSGRARNQISAATQSPQGSVGDTIRLEPTSGRLESRKRTVKPNYFDEGSSAAENGMDDDDHEPTSSRKTHESSHGELWTLQEPKVEHQLYDYGQPAVKKNKGGRPKKISTSTLFGSQVVAQADVKIELDPVALLKEQKRAAKSAKMSAIAKGRWARGEMDNVAAKRKANNALKKAAKAAALLNQGATEAPSTPTLGAPITTPTTTVPQSDPDTNTSIRKSSRPKAQSAKSRRNLGLLMDGAGGSDSELAPAKLTVLTSNSGNPVRKISAYEEFQQLASPLGSPLGRGKRPAALKAKQSFNRYGDESEMEYDDMSGIQEPDREEADREADAEQDVDTEINRQFASEYDRYQALASPGNEIVLGKRVRKPVVNLREAMAIEAGEEDDDDFDV